MAPEGGGDRFERGEPHGRVAHHAALPHLVTGRLELGLDERQEAPVRSQELKDRRKHHADRREGDVAHRKVHGRAGLVVGKVDHVGALAKRHARVPAQTPVELRVSHVNGQHALGTMPEQAVREAPRGAAHIQAGKPPRVHVERREGVLELEGPTSHIGKMTPDVQGQPRPHLLSR